MDSVNLSIEKSGRRGWSMPWQCVKFAAMVVASVTLFAGSAFALTHCGGSAGGMFPSAPTTGLCSAGYSVYAPVTPLGATQFQWKCAVNGFTGWVLTTVEACTANKKYNGQCGSANGTATASAPTANHCLLGTASTPALSGTNYNWTCAGIMPATGATIVNCAAPVAPSIVQAVNETVSTAAGTAGNENVRANDTAPPGSVYSLAAGSTCSPLSITALGVVNYTAPAAGQSCSVNYTVCNSGQCSNATLTVNATAAPLIVQAVSEAVTATGGASGSENVRANDTAPPGSVYSLAAGSTCNPISITALGVVSYSAPPVGQSCTVNYTACNSGQCSTATLTVSAPVPLKTIGVVVSGLPSGASVVLQNNGANNLTVSANGAATFGTGVAGAYAVTVATQPTGATCVVSAGAGTATANVSNIAVVCTPGRFSLVPKAAGGFYDVTLVSKTAGGFYDVKECVKDKVTGLIWEGKTLAGPRSVGIGFSNLDDPNQAQVANNSGGVWVITNPTPSQVAASTNTIGYKNYVNSAALCGFVDWRLPTRTELQNLSVAVGGPSGNDLQVWFQNQQGWLWTSTIFQVGSHPGTFVEFANGSSFGQGRTTPLGVRLVR